MRSPLRSSARGGCGRLRSWSRSRRARVIGALIGRHGHSRSRRATVAARRRAAIRVAGVRVSTVRIPAPAIATRALAVAPLTAAACLSILLGCHESDSRHCQQHGATQNPLQNHDRLLHYLGKMDSWVIRRAIARRSPTGSATIAFRMPDKPGSADLASPFYRISPLYTDLTQSLSNSSNFRVCPDAGCFV